MQGLVALSRLGVYIRLPGVDVAKFEQSMQGGGLLGYIDTLSGGSLSKVGVFSLGTLNCMLAGLLVAMKQLLDCTQPPDQEPLPIAMPEQYDTLSKESSDPLVQGAWEGYSLKE